MEQRTTREIRQSNFALIRPETGERDKEERRKWTTENLLLRTNILHRGGANPNHKKKGGGDLGAEGERG